MKLIASMILFFSATVANAQMPGVDNHLGRYESPLTHRSLGEQRLTMQLALCARHRPEAGTLKRNL